MKISEIQSHNISHHISIPFPVHWSDDDVIVTATEKGIQILRTSLRRSDDIVKNWCNSIAGIKMARLVYCFAIIIALIQPTVCSNITYNVFGTATDGLPAAFGDFDADKYTDLFVIMSDRKTIKVLLGSDAEPLLRESDALKCTFDGNKKITSVVPGDFDGDAYMDVLVTVRNPDLVDEKKFPHINEVYVLWGHHDKLDCNVKNSLFLLYGQPLAVDCNQDMVIDLFGVRGDPNTDKEKERGFWIFNKNHSSPFTYKKMELPRDFDHGNIELKMPHSNAFIDLNYDNYGDLYLTTKNGSAEVWLFDKISRQFQFDHFIHPPAGVDISDKNKHHYIGQTVFQDMALEGKINQVIPVCFDANCVNNTIYLRSETGDQPRWYNIKVHFKDWHFVNPLGSGGSLPYLETLTLRAGDFNMDGYPDLLATLVFNGQYRTYLLENVECDSTQNCDGFTRTFVLRENALSPYNNNTVLGVFYDFLQDGILDIIFVHSKPLRVSAFRNSLDYDANFVKVMVLTGLTHDRKPAVFNPLMKNRSAYVTNLPGPTIIYNTTTQEGDPRSAVSTQLPQSAHFSLNLPYTIFGLGRTPNFVDELSVGVYGQKGKWTQLIPNSQMVVIPWPANDASRWRVQLFVTPSKLIFQSFCALLGTCALISLIIGGLYWKERKEDHKEKLQEAQKFHFDAM